MALGRDWMWIARDWKRCLERTNKLLSKEGRPRIQRFHATDLNSHYKDFKGWSKDEERDLTQELIGILGQYHIHFIGYTVDLQELAEVFPEFDSDPVREAYGVLSKTMLVEIGKQAIHFRTDPEIAVVFGTSPYASEMHKSFDALISDEDLSARYNFKSIVGHPWQRFIPLQVADLIAFEATKERDRRMVARHRRMSFRALIGNPSCGGRGLHLNRESLEQLRQRAQALWV